MLGNWNERVVMVEEEESEKAKQCITHHHAPSKVPDPCPPYRTFQYCQWGIATTHHITDSMSKKNQASLRHGHHRYGPRIRRLMR